MRVLKAKVSGKVQGVWFRKYTLDSARDLAIVGMVKNLIDGTVLVNASGKDENLREFKRFLISRYSSFNSELFCNSYSNFSLSKSFNSLSM